MHPAHAALYRIDTVSQFGKHAAADKAVLDQLICLIQCQHGHQRRGISSIPAHPFYISHKGQLLCLDGFSDGTRRIVGVNIIGLKIISETDGGDDRYKIIFQKSIDKLAVYFFYITYITDIPAIYHFLIAVDRAAILSADSGSPDAKLLHHLHQMFVYFI